MIPEEWAALLQRKGIARSYRALGERAEVSHEAVRRVITGRSVKRSTLDAVAGALGVDPEVLQELRGEDPAKGPRPWYPPEAAALLTRDEREALSRLIGLMTKGRGDDRGDAAPMKQAGAHITPMPDEARRRRTGASQRRPRSPRGRTQD